jgi:hypothetical protein
MQRGKLRAMDFALPLREFTAWGIDDERKNSEQKMAAIICRLVLSGAFYYIQCVFPKGKKQ